MARGLSVAGDVCTTDKRVRTAYRAACDAAMREARQAVERLSVFRGGGRRLARSGLSITPRPPGVRPAKRSLFPQRPSRLKIPVLHVRTVRNLILDPPNRSGRYEPAIRDIVRYIYKYTNENKNQTIAKKMICVSPHAYENLVSS